GASTWLCLDSDRPRLGEERGALGTRMAQIAAAAPPLWTAQSRLRNKERRPTIDRLGSPPPELNSELGFADEQLRFHSGHAAAALTNKAKMGRTNCPG